MALYKRLNYGAAAAAAAKSLQSWPTLYDPIDGSPPGSPVPGILQARTLEWVAISFSSTWKWKVKVKSLSCVQLLVTPWTAAYQVPLSIGFSRQEYWSGVPLPSLNHGADNFITGESSANFLSTKAPQLTRRWRGAGRREGCPKTRMGKRWYQGILTVPALGLNFF